MFEQKKVYFNKFSYPFEKHLKNILKDKGLKCPCYSEFIVITKTGPI